MCVCLRGQLDKNYSKSVELVTERCIKKSVEGDLPIPTRGFASDRRGTVSGRGCSMFHEHE